MNMKKYVSAIAALAMAAGLVTLPANAAEGTAITFDGGTYTITAPGNYYIDDDFDGIDEAIINNAGGVTLDLNGHSIINNNGAAIVNNNNGTMTIINSEAGVEVIGGTNAVDNYGTLTIEDGYFEADDDSAVYNQGGTLTINGGEFVGHVSGVSTIGPGNWEDVYNGGVWSGSLYSFSEEYASVTINGGTFSAGAVNSQSITVGSGMTINGYSDVTISGGTFSGGMTALTTNGVYGPIKLEITDGTFNSLVGAYLMENGLLELDISGGSFTAGLDMQIDNADTGYANITGGTFTTENGYAQTANSGSSEKAAIVLGADCYNVTIGGDTVVEATGEDVAAVVVEVSNTNWNTKAYITGGTYSAESGYVIYNDLGSTTKAKIGMLEVTGGTITGDGVKYITLADDVVCNANTGKTFEINCSIINGGTFNDAVLTGSNNDDFYTITGGTFNFADPSFNLQTFKSGSKYMLQTGSFVKKNDDSSSEVGSTADSTIIEGTVISAIKDDGTYDQMDVDSDTFTTGTTGVTYTITFSGAGYDGVRYVDHGFGGTYTGSVVYALILEDIPVGVTAVVTAE